MIILLRLLFLVLSFLSQAYTVLGGSFLVEGGMYRVVVVTYCIRVSLKFLLLTSSFLGCSDLTGGCQASDEECKGERRLVQWIRWGLGNCGLSQPTAFHSYRHWQNHSRNTCVHPPPPSFSVHNFAWRSLKFASTPRVLSIIEKFIPFYAHPMKETRNLCLCICCFADTPFFLDFRSSCLLCSLPSLAGASCPVLLFPVVRGRDPSAVAVLVEDGAAVSGVVLAAVCLGLTSYTGSPTYDAIGSLLIGGEMLHPRALMVTTSTSCKTSERQKAGVDMWSAVNLGACVVFWNDFAVACKARLPYRVY